MNIYIHLLSYLWSIKFFIRVTIVFTKCKCLNFIVLHCIYLTSNHITLTVLKYYTMHTVTMVPIKTDLIELSIMTAEEISWLNTYHAQVRHHLLPLMQTHFPHIVDYLIQETEPIVMLSKQPFEKD